MSEKSDLEREILELHSEHPDWSEAKIGRELGCTDLKVAKVIGDHEAASEPDPISDAPTTPHLKGLAVTSVVLWIAFFAPSFPYQVALLAASWVATPILVLLDGMAADLPTEWRRAALAAVILPMFIGPLYIYRRTWW